MAIDTLGRVEHTRFDHFSEFLHGGDLLVFNSSRTLGLVAGVERGPCTRSGWLTSPGRFMARISHLSEGSFACGLRLKCM